MQLDLFDLKGIKAEETETVLLEKHSPEAQNDKGRLCGRATSF